MFRLAHDLFLVRCRRFPKVTTAFTARYFGGIPGSCGGPADATRMPTWCLFATS